MSSGEVWEVKPVRQSGLLGNSPRGPRNCDRTAVLHMGVP